MDMFRPTPEQIKSFVLKYFPECKPRKNGTELRINSPFLEDTGRHFNINVSTGQCHDWRSDDWAGPKNPKTNKRGCTFLKFASLFLGCSQEQAALLIGGLATADPVFRKPQGHQKVSKAETEPSLALPNGSLKLAGATDLASRLVRNELWRRGVDDGLIEHFQIHYCGTDIVWPYYEFGVLVYWQTRSITNKTFNFPLEEATGVSKEYLYGFDDVEQAADLIITEAIFDQHMLLSQTVASGGAALVPGQISRIRLLGPKRVILAADNDMAGIKSVITNEAILRAAGFNVYYSLPPKLSNEKGTSKDWNDLFVMLGLDRSDIRREFERAIKPLTVPERIRLSARAVPMRQFV